MRTWAKMRVRRVCAAFAAGRILNPLLVVRSQYVGGLIGGIGMALHEQTVTDRASGRILGQTFADYLIPVHADMPEFDIAMIEEDDPHPARRRQGRRHAGQRRHPGRHRQRGCSTPSASWVRPSADPDRGCDRELGW